MLGTIEADLAGGKLRLTLNVLLSFAQFEREVIGERIRDKRPIEVVVLNCCVTETNDALLASRISTILAKSASERVSRSIL